MLRGRAVVHATPQPRMNPAVVHTNRSKPILVRIPRWVSLGHRWLGIALGVSFALWFASGTVLSFVPFPSLGQLERISRAEPLDLQEVYVPPAAALATAGTAPIAHLRLINVAAHPRYVLSFFDRPVMSVSAQSGEALPPVSASTAGVVAEQFSGDRISRIEGPFDYDQWTVHDQYGPYRPFYKATLDDAAGTCVYISARSGEVMQRTRRTERAWNWAGAVIHWINPTLLRKHAAVWHSTIWSLALAGVILVIAGVWLGIVRYVNLKRLRRPGISPFTGWLRWHHSIGLFAGVFMLSWISSGWLSLDHGMLFSGDQPTLAQVERLQGVSLAEAARAVPVIRLRELHDAREIEITATGGHPFLIVRNREPQFSRLESANEEGGFDTQRVIPDKLLLSAVRTAWSPFGVLGIQAIAVDDLYRVRSNPLPDTARRIVLDDPTHTWVQIDAASGQVISVMDTSQRLRRWLVDGLHSFDFPFLEHVGLLRHSLILLSAATGFLFSCTAVVIGVKRLRNLLGRRTAAPLPVARLRP
jgi:hypothetical protein